MGKRYDMAQVTEEVPRGAAPETGSLSLAGSAQALSVKGGEALRDGPGATFDPAHHELWRTAGQALAECRQAVGDEVSIVVDGGIRRDGALDLALPFRGDTAMLGSAFAGTQETSGKVVQKPVVLPDATRTAQVPFRAPRGIASIGAIRDWLDLDDMAEADLEAPGAENLGSLGASSRLGPRDHPRHGAASLLGGELRRPREPHRSAPPVGSARALRDQALGGGAARTLRAALTRFLLSSPTSDPLTRRG
jgi:hypothetical protein